MFKVTLINHTPDALATLLFTKNTRLQLSPEGLEEVKRWPEDRKAAELNHMRHTIQSQFEFIDYIFSIESVTRAFTQQLERHRIGTSFAERSLRLPIGAAFGYETGPSIESDPARLERYCDTMAMIDAEYQELIRDGADAQDARGILPLNIQTNIVFKGNLRTLSEMAKKRLCVRTQGEFQNVFRAMRLAVLAVHPWAEPFLRVWCAVHGTCQFHELPADKCPIKPHVYNPYSATNYGAATSELLPVERIQALWESERAAPQPVVKR